MCGIAGILLTESVAADVSSAAKAMQRSLRHRGPDGNGIWVTPGGRVAFAHNRLAILDLSPAGRQPMNSPDGRFTITFNGEIYNFLELRAQLEAEGVVFHTQTDTEVLLQLYARDGNRCVEQLRGMFAFAIWDEKEQKAFLARDAFGIKPLYYSLQNQRLVFASELRALLSSGLIEKKLSPTAILHFLKSGSVPEPYTLLEDVHMLEAGSYLEWTPRESRFEPWWQLHFQPNDDITAEVATQLLRGSLIDSIEHHFISDVPVGIFLSGGLDSTALLALARATGRENIETFTIGVDNTALDESSLARRSAHHFGTRHHELLLDAESGQQMFLNFLEWTDQPSIDGFNTFCVSHLARHEGMKVVLSGLGGDELMAGYPSFARLPKLLQRTSLLGPAKKPLGNLLERFAPHGNLRRLGSALAAGGSLDDLYRAFRGIFSRREALLLTHAIIGQTPCEDFGELPVPPLQPCQLEDIGALELSRYMRNQLLRDSDVMSMAWGLELRVPLLDKGVFGALAQIPAALRLRQGKQLLIDAVPEIPDWIKNRPKGAFLFPYQQWLESSQWEDSFKKSVAQCPVKTESWYQKWSVFMLKHWMEREGIAPA